MDVLTDLLEGPRAKGAFLLRAILDPPWSMRIQDRAPLSIVAVACGEAWVVFESGRPTRLSPGDVAVMRGPEPYIFADRPDTEPQVVVHPGEHCATPDGRSLAGEMSLGVRTWGNSPTGSTVMLVGTYRMHGEISQRLLSALPQLVALPADSWGSPLVTLLGNEIDKDEPGQEAFLDRLLDLLLIGALRAWFSRPESAAPAWYRANGDPVVGKALRLLHHEPARPWTIAVLAAETGVSRAALARRFTELVGEPPMSYLADWRLDLAADLLRESDDTIGSVARKVGYGSPFALSNAFKRRRGISPLKYRAAALGGFSGRLMNTTSANCRIVVAQGLGSARTAVCGRMVGWGSGRIGQNGG